MSFTKNIQAYLDRWEEKDLISHEQKIGILKDLAQESSSKSFFKILGTIGAICIGMGVLLVISSNWGFFPKTIQLILTLLLPTVPLLC